MYINFISFIYSERQRTFISRPVQMISICRSLVGGLIKDQDSLSLSQQDAAKDEGPSMQSGGKLQISSGTATKMISYLGVKVSRI